MMPLSSCFAKWAIRNTPSFVIGSLFGGALTAAIASGVANAATGFSSAFECGDVIGKVFEDNNRNGVQDDGEPGLPGVRLATARGLLTVTDPHGRYHVTCAQLPQRSIGSTFLLKVDQRSLPTGHRITTENPRSIRLSRGKVSRINFGASKARVVRLNLADAAFERGGIDLNPKWDAGINQLLAVLNQDASVLRVIYEKGAEDKALAKARMKAVAGLVEQRWQKHDRKYALEIERRMIVGH